MTNHTEEEAYLDTMPGANCVVCNNSVDIYTGGRRPDGRTWIYFCQGKHTSKEIDAAIEEKEV